MGAYTTILYEVKDKVAHIILNRPEKMNAISPQLQKEVLSALRVAEQDDSVGCIVVKGAGRTFSAGYDMTPAAGHLTPQDQPAPRAGASMISPTLDGIMDAGAHDKVKTWTAIWDCHKAVIAQVHGHALAGGSELMSQCDIILVAEDALIGYPVVRVRSPGDVVWAPWRMPMAKAMHFMLTGKPMTGKQAEEWGVATFCYPADRLDEETEKLAKQITHVDVDLQAITKRSMHRAYEIMGYKMALEIGADTHTLANYRPGGGEFQRIIREKGLKTALLWRDGPWGDYSALTRGQQAAKR